jgi:type VI secretion system protein ImpE
MNARDLFHAGQLAEAVAAATAEVRQNPTDSHRRLFLAELLCFSGQLERVDVQLDAVLESDPQVVAGIQTFRQVIRAEQARQQFFTEGHLPTFLARPEGAVRLSLEASIRVREGAFPEAALLLDQAEAQRPRVSGVCNGEPFQDFRDVDDVTSCILEVLTSNGEYYWIPIAQIESLEFGEPERAFDHIWRRTHLIVRDGPDGEVFLPVLYAAAAQEADDRIRLGRMTDWRGGDATPIRGVGQRMFLVGEDDLPIMELKTVTFDERQVQPAKESD